MIIRKPILVILLGLLLMGKTTIAQAACGSWIANPPGCYDVDTYDPLEGETVMCGVGTLCCHTIEECGQDDDDPFGDTDPPSPVEPDDPPADDPVDPVDPPADDPPEQPGPGDQNPADPPCQGNQPGTCPAGQTCVGMYVSGVGTLYSCEPVDDPDDPICQGDQFGVCPAGQTCEELYLSGTERVYVCQQSGDPADILDPTDDDWPMTQDEKDSAIFHNCGTFWSGDGNGVCRNVNTDQNLTPFAMCSSLGGATTCCRSMLYCRLAFEDVIDDEPDADDEVSEHVCGEYQTSGYLRSCFGVDNLPIPDAVSCESAGFPTQCCVSEDYCGANPSADDDRPDPEDFKYCQQVPGDVDDPSTERGACMVCMGPWVEAEKKYQNEGEKIFTALGCVSVSGKALAEDLIRLLLGVAGGVAFLSMLAAAFHYTVSRGEANKIKEAKELITAAVSGLLFIIFSIIILNFIGVEVLHLPGLG